MAIHIKNWCRPLLRVETLVILSAVFFTLACNFSFWHELAQGRDLTSFNTLMVFLLLGLFITATQAFLLLLVANRWTIKPLLIILFCCTAAAVYFMSKYGIYLDTAMLRNLIETDQKEAGDLLQWDMTIALVIIGLLPSCLVYRTQLIILPWKKAALVRCMALLCLLLVSVSSGWLVMNDLAPTMRQHKNMRYLITPANYLYSLSRALYSHHQAVNTVKAVIAPDARQVSDAKRKPRAFVIFVGETQRAANWGLNGYSRQTTPELSKRGVLNFNDATSCGTDTAESVPCMFSVYGRHQYDEQKIRTSQSLLDVVNRAGISVYWFDNQSGCKGVCDNVPNEDITKTKDPRFCKKGKCFDEILIDAVAQKINATPGDTLIVAHMIGSHGPAYYQRYPETFKKWSPTCDTSDIATCTKEQIVNTYDNTMLYADYVIAKMIDSLASVNSHDVAFLFMSDHGESLGENNLYLHGFPYAIAPETQKKIPMVMWLSPAMGKSLGLNESCLTKRQKDAVSHDNLFPTVLGGLDIQTTAYNASFDLFAGCRNTH